VQLHNGSDPFPENFKRGALAIGNFDGVHHGHAQIASQVRQRAEQFGGPAIIFTFDPHPVRVLRPELTPPPLTWTKRKADLLGELGIDGMIAFPTTRALLDLTPEEFFKRIIIEGLDAKAMVEGPNFNFGKNRAGNTKVLRSLCEQYDVTLDILEPSVRGEENEFISSSRIRNLISEGNVLAARRMLTHPYRLRGMVTHGAGRGAKIGVPTANLEAVDTMVPKLGVYAGLGYLGNCSYPAAIHIGPNPTFGELGRKIEVHLIGFEGNCYGEPLEIAFLDHLRDIESFAGVDALVKQLSTDIDSARNIAESFHANTSD